jgi:hypothetical protein
MSIGHKYSDLELKSAVITWRHMMRQGPEFDIEGEKKPINDTDCLWVIDNFTQISDSLDHTYFYTFHSYPSSWEGNFSRSQMISDMNNSYNARLVHYYKLRQILEHNNKSELVLDCNKHISMTLEKIKPDPSSIYIRFNYQN